MPTTAAQDFDAFVTARWLSLVRTAYLMGCRPDEAEDAAQATLVSVWRHWRRVSNADSPEAYVTRCLLNEVRRGARRRPRSSARFSTEPTMRDTSDAALARIDVWRLLDSLSHDQRTVVVLRHLEDRSEAEVAALLGVAPGTVKSRLSRAMSHLAAVAATQEQAVEPRRGE